MAARPDQVLVNANVRPKTVQAAQTVAYGRVVKLGAVDSECLQSAAGEGGFGIAMKDGAAGELISVCMLGGGAIHPVVVGTGGATRDSLAVVVANGVTNAVALGGGTVARNIIGKFTQSGVAGDLVGLRLTDFTGVSA